MTVAYEAATLAKYQQVRGDTDAHLFPRLMDDGNFRAIIQIAFEAGRDWQSKHPAASIEFPDYDAPEVDQAATDAAVRAVEILASALEEAATNLAQAAESARRRGQHDKASMFDSDSTQARARILEARRFISEAKTS